MAELRVDIADVVDDTVWDEAEDGICTREDDDNADDWGGASGSSDAAAPRAASDSWSGGTCHVALYKPNHLNSQYSTPNE